MKKIRSTLSRYRLLTNVLALVFVLGTFAAPSVRADVEPVLEFQCTAGCVNWVDGQGCLECMRCCSGLGWWFCYTDNRIC